MVRNCIFEPTENRGYDPINYAMKEIEAAFNLNKIAIVSSHRVNFCGHIDSNNRKNGLKSLKELLIRIVKKYPDVEFMFAPEAMNLLVGK
jgi:hypothetical protein